MEIEITPVLIDYIALLEQTGNPNSPECVAFKNDHAFDPDFVSSVTDVDKLHDAMSPFRPVVKQSIAKSMYCYEHPRPAFTVDAVLFAPNGAGGMSVLLIRRGKPPFEGQYAFPGGFVEQNERSKPAAIRELQEETGLVVEDLEFLKICDDPDRDPRGRVIGHAYVGLLDSPSEVEGGDDAASAEWVPISDIGPNDLAFDHNLTLANGLLWLNDQRKKERFI